MEHARLLPEANRRALSFAFVALCDFSHQCSSATCIPASRRPPLNFDLGAGSDDGT